MTLLTRTVLLCSALVLGTAAMTGCAGNSKTESTGGYIDDSVITTKVKAELLAEKSISSVGITVKTFKGRVQLSGFVASRSEADKAASVARSVAGVRVVENNLLVK